MRVLYVEGVPLGKAVPRSAERGTPGGGHAFPPRPRAAESRRLRCATSAAELSRKEQGERRRVVPSRRRDGGEASKRGARAPCS